MALPRADFTPKLITLLRGGYTVADLRADAFAGLTVAIVALPLAMALGIASGASPMQGLVTAIIAGFLISALGGSRVQIGGPTGAFVVVVAGVIAEHGYDGLILATLMAGALLLLAGYARAGALVRFIPHPVITGFTAGIAVIIATSQIKDLLGLSIDRLPADVPHQWQAYAQALTTLNPAALGTGVVTLALILLLRRFAPRLPGFLVAIAVAALAVAVLGLPVVTVGDRFPDMAATLPTPSLPDVSLLRLRALLPSAFTIAFLAGLEALLSAVVADGMTGYRHRPNQELVGQGVANLASALFGGLPATGAIARTATNVRAGARSPVAGIVHALLLLVFLMAGRDLIARVPLPALAAILLVVAWGMSEAERFAQLLRMPAGDRVVLLLTFALTVFIDLTVAIGVGVTLASLLFMERMSRLVSIESSAGEDEDQRAALPPGVEVFRITGPVFFGVAGDLIDTLKRTGAPPRALILRMREVPMIDASGIAAIASLAAQAGRTGCRLILAGVQPQPARLLRRAGMGPRADGARYASTFEEALALASAETAQ